MATASTAAVYLVFAALPALADDESGLSPQAEPSATSTLDQDQPADLSGGPVSPVVTCAVQPASVDGTQDVVLSMTQTGGGNGTKNGFIVTAPGGAVILEVRQGGPATEHDSYTHTLSRLALTEPGLYQVSCIAWHDNSVRAGQASATFTLQQPEPSPTPSPTQPQATRTPTPSASPTPSVSPSGTPSPSQTPAPTPSPSQPVIVATLTPTPTPSASPSPTPSPSQPVIVASPTTTPSTTPSPMPDPADPAATPPTAPARETIPGTGLAIVPAAAITPPDAGEELSFARPQPLTADPAVPAGGQELSATGADPLPAALLAIVSFGLGLLTLALRSRRLRVIGG